MTWYCLGSPERTEQGRTRLVHWGSMRRGSCADHRVSRCKNKNRRCQIQKTDLASIQLKLQIQFCKRFNTFIYFYSWGSIYNSFWRRRIIEYNSHMTKAAVRVWAEPLSTFTRCATILTIWFSHISVSQLRSPLPTRGPPILSALSVWMLPTCSLVPWIFLWKPQDILWDHMLSFLIFISSV